MWKILNIQYIIVFNNQMIFERKCQKAMQTESEIKRLERLWKNLEELSDMAKEYGINDIFQDNGGKTLQQLVYMGLKATPGREGSDGVDDKGIEYEMKSINIETSASGFSTNHHVTHDVIERYKDRPWMFSIYEGIELKEIYILQPENMLSIYEKWENKLQYKTHLNNPKIPIKYVKENGKRCL